MKKNKMHVCSQSILALLRAIAFSTAFSSFKSSSFRAAVLLDPDRGDPDELLWPDAALFCPTSDLGSTVSIVDMLLWDFDILCELDRFFVYKNIQDLELFKTFGETMVIASALNNYIAQ